MFVKNLQVQNQQLGEKQRDNQRIHDRLVGDKRSTGGKYVIAFDERNKNLVYAKKYVHYSM